MVIVTIEICVQAYICLTDQKYVKHTKYSSADGISDIKYYYSIDDYILSLWALLSYLIGMTFLRLS